MEILTLDRVRMMTRIEFSESEEPFVIELCEISEHLTQEVLNNDFSIYKDGNGKIHTPIQHACFLLLNQLLEYYICRVPLAIYDIPFTYVVLLEPYATKGISQRVFNLKNELKKRVEEMLLAKGIINQN